MWNMNMTQLPGLWTPNIDHDTDSRSHPKLYPVFSDLKNDPYWQMMFCMWRVFRERAGEGGWTVSGSGVPNDWAIELYIVCIVWMEYFFVRVFSVIFCRYCKVYDSFCEAVLFHLQFFIRLLFMNDADDNIIKTTLRREHRFFRTPICLYFWDLKERSKKQIQVQMWFFFIVSLKPTTRENRSCGSCYWLVSIISCS